MEGSEIRRRSNGSIDTESYCLVARRLRAEAIGKGLRKGLLHRLVLAFRARAGRWPFGATRAVGLPRR